jgi:predicted nucleic-acid-binding protein
LGSDPPSDPRGARQAAPLTAFLDTNVLIRHLTGDPPKQAARATAILSGPGPLLLADLILAECVYVLESFYEVEPPRIAELMRAALALPSIAAVDTGLLVRALEVYETARLDFAKAYLVAQAETTGVGEIVSFDRSIDRIKSVSRREP